MGLELGRTGVLDWLVCTPEGYIQTGLVSIQMDIKGDYGAKNVQGRVRRVKTVWRFHPFEC
jgi:hypothetical protein